MALRRTLMVRNNEQFDLLGYSTADVAAALRIEGVPVSGHGTSGFNKKNAETLSLWIRASKSTRVPWTLMQLQVLVRQPVKPNPLNIEPIIKGSATFELADKNVVVTKGTDRMVLATENGYAKCVDVPDSVGFKADPARALLAQELSTFTEISNGEVYVKSGDVTGFASDYAQEAVAQAALGVVTDMNKDSPMPNVTKGLTLGSAVYDRLSRYSKDDVLYTLNQLATYETSKLQEKYTYTTQKVKTLEGENVYDKLKKQRNMPIPKDSWFKVTGDEKSELSVRKFYLLSLRAVGNHKSGMGAMAANYIDGVPLSGETRKYANFWHSIKHIDFTKEREVALNIKNQTLALFLWKQAFMSCVSYIEKHPDTPPLKFYCVGEKGMNEQPSLERQGGVIPVLSWSKLSNALYIDFTATDSNLVDMPKARQEGRDWVAAREGIWSAFKKKCVVCPFMTVKLGVGDVYQLPQSYAGYYMATSGCAVVQAPLCVSGEDCARFYSTVQVMAWLRHRYYYFRVTYETFVVKFASLVKLDSFGRVRFFTITKQDLGSIDIDTDSSFCDEGVMADFTQMVDDTLEGVEKGKVDLLARNPVAPKVQEEVFAAEEGTDYGGDEELA